MWPVLSGGKSLHSSLMWDVDHARSLLVGLIYTLYATVTKSRCSHVRHWGPNDRVSYAARLAATCAARSSLIAM